MYDVAVLPHRNAYASEVGTGATWGLTGAPSVGRRAAYRLSGTVVTTTEPFASSAAIISPLSRATPMWNESERLAAHHEQVAGLDLGRGHRLVVRVDLADQVGQRRVGLPRDPGRAEAAVLVRAGGGHAVRLAEQTECPVDRADRLGGQDPDGPAAGSHGRGAGDGRTAAGERLEAGRELGRVLQYGGRRGSDLRGRQLGQIGLPARRAPAGCGRVAVAWRAAEAPSRSASLSLPSRTRRRRPSAAPRR